MATAVCRVIKKHYPDARLIVVTGYPEVFNCNPFIYKALPFFTPYFYQDYVQGQEVKFLVHDPYHETAFYRQEEHLIKTWCSMFGLHYDNESPELFMSKIEHELYSPLFTGQKPIMVIQTNGGGKPQPGQPALNYSWARDMPIITAQKVVNAFADEYAVVHVRRNDSWHWRMFQQ